MKNSKNDYSAVRRWYNRKRRFLYQVKKQKRVFINIIKTPQGIAGTFIIAGLILSALVGPWITPQDPFKIDIANRFASPSFKYLLGTDFLGRDILSRIIVSTRVVIPISLSVIAIITIVGMALGMVAGYYSNTIVEKIIIWMFDSINTFPGLILVLALAAIVGSSSKMALIFLMSLWRFPGYGRVARVETLSVKEEVYIKAAQALGVKEKGILFHHIMPNIISPIIVLAGMDFGVVTMMLAGLSFLGMGIQPPAPSLGRMLHEGYVYIHQSSWMLVGPILALSVIMIGSSLFSTALRIALNPKESFGR